MKHLIIEGCDRTGKDTLIKNLLPYCQNAIITHFSTPEGSTDQEKRDFQESSFKQEFGKSYWLLKSDLFQPPKKEKMNIIFWNRAHLGEFVYGNLYRETNPEEWVMELEKMYEYDSMDEIYLLLLTADPDFLSARDDGESFDSSSDARKKEQENFEKAFDLSTIKKKLKIKIDKLHVPTPEHIALMHADPTPRMVYRESSEITKEVLQFLKS